MAAKNKSDGWHELNHLVIFQNDNYGYKARPQMLAEKKQRTNVWKQIGAQEPKVAAAKLMKQNDNFGYKVF
jgi:hypothetical protein